MFVWLLTAAFACGDDEGDYIELSELAAPPPSFEDAGIDVPDGATACTTDEECEDGLACTVDLCAFNTYCHHRPEPARCSDGVFCNGAERCDPVAGCLPGVPPLCDDREVCTVDRCDEAAGACVYAPRDFDGDGEVDWHCGDGTDCDDLDPTRNAAVAELCGDLRDNDCDDLIDEATCGGPPHDTCEDALDVSAGGTFELLLSGAAANHGLSCVKESVPDVVVTFALERAMDVHLTVRARQFNGADETASMAVRRDCSDPASEFECVANGFPDRHVRMRALPAGRYYAVAGPDFSSPWVRSAVVTARFTEPTEAPQNTTCETAQDISGGGRFAGSFVDVSDDYITPCGVPGLEEEAFRQADVVYQFTLDAPQDVTLAALTLTDDPISMEVRDECAVPESTLRCERDAPATIVMHEAQPGTYYVILESPTNLEADYELDMRLSPPTPPPLGDDCDHPQPIEPLGEPVTASLTSRQARVPTSCDLGAADTVFRFTLDELRDLSVMIDSGGLATAVAVQSACGDLDGELACVRVAGGEFTVRGLSPGEYFVVAESFDAPEINVELTTQTHIVPVQVENNDDCATATVVPPEGGVFAGDTTTLTDDYEAAFCDGADAPDGVYLLTLQAPATVRVQLEPEFDGVIYRFPAGTGPQACAGSAELCRDASLTVEVLEEDLPAGAYYYVIDGNQADDAGAYEVRFGVN